MARPRKLESDIRVHQTNIRLTDTEHEFAEKQAELAGLSIANWFRKTAFSKNALQIKVSPMHRSYYIQLRGIANNLNQATKRINSRQYPKIHKELLEVKILLVEINKLFHK